MKTNYLLEDYAIRKREERLKIYDRKREKSMPSPNTYTAKQIDKQLAFALDKISNAFTEQSISEEVAPYVLLDMINSYTAVMSPTEKHRMAEALFEVATVFKE